MILINNYTVMFPLLLMHIQLLPTMSSYMCALLEFFIFNRYPMRNFCLRSNYPIVTKREQSCAAIYDKQNLLIICFPHQELLHASPSCKHHSCRNHNLPLHLHVLLIYVGYCQRDFSQKPSTNHSCAAILTKYNM